MSQHNIHEFVYNNLVQLLNSDNDINHDYIASIVKLGLENGISFETIINIALRSIEIQKLEASISILETLLQYSPENYLALNACGIALKRSRKLEEAKTIFTKAINIAPTEPSAWNNIGNTFIELQSFEEAFNAFTKLCELQPQNPEALRMKGASLAMLTEYEKATYILEEALSLNPNNLNTYIDLASAQYNLKNYNKAETIIEKALEIFPSDISLIKTKAMIIRPLGRAIECIELLQKVLDSNPKDASAMLALANAYYYSLGDEINANKYYALAYQLNPNNPALIHKMCCFFLTLRGSGIQEGENLSIAHQLIVKLMSLVKDMRQYAYSAQSIFLSTLDYENFDKINNSYDLMLYWKDNHDNSAMATRLSRVKTLEDRFKIRDVHLAWGMQQEEAANKTPIKRKVRQRIYKKTRLGIISSDLRNHPVAYFVWPLIDHIDKSKFEIYCYSRYPNPPGEIQQLFMNNVASFKTYIEQPHIEIAQSVSNDNLDALLELGGLTSYSAAGICPYKPAPIQISWLGYPHSLGLPNTIDYIMLDPYIQPSIPELLIEKTFLLPKTWVAIENKIGFRDAEITNQLPEDINGYITIGTLNMPHKLTLSSLKAWADVMHSIPNSKFLYVRPETDSNVFRSNFIKHMLSFGITDDRIHFGSTRTDHLVYYNKIDIAVDTFPHTGGTTTCEALWMGVPVVTLVGIGISERLSYSNLNNAALPEFCTFNIEDYKQTIVALAKDKEKRYYLRRNLRSQILENPLGNPIEFASDFSTTLNSILG